jgi:hypothetical protein
MQASTSVMKSQFYPASPRSGNGRSQLRHGDVGLGLLAGPDTGIPLGEVYRATGKDVPLLNELVKKCGAAIPPVEVIEDNGRVEEDSSHQRFLVPDGVLEPFIGLRPDLLDIGGAALNQFRVVGGIPGASGKLQGFALLVAPHVAPEDIDGVARPPLVFGLGQPVKLVGQFFRYFDDAWHRFLG